MLLRLSDVFLFLSSGLRERNVDFGGRRDDNLELRTQVAWACNRCV
jgi:hypothetical protein